MRVRNIIKHLEMMGYDVVNNTVRQYIMVMFTTRSGYRAYYTTQYSELEKDYIVEHIVRKINDVIMTDL